MRGEEASISRVEPKSERFDADDISHPQPVPGAIDAREHERGNVLENCGRIIPTLPAPMDSEAKPRC
jgi:hypothetical protein